MLLKLQVDLCRSFGEQRVPLRLPEGASPRFYAAISWIGSMLTSNFNWQVACLMWLTSRDWHTLLSQKELLSFKKKQKTVLSISLRTLTRRCHFRMIHLNPDTLSAKINQLTRVILNPTPLLSQSHLLTRKYYNRIHLRAHLLHWNESKMDRTLGVSFACALPPLQIAHRRHPLKSLVALSFSPFGIAFVDLPSDRCGNRQFKALQRGKSSASVLCDLLK